MAETDDWSPFIIREPCLYKSLGKFWQFYYNVTEASEEVVTNQNLLHNLSRVPKFKLNFSH